jgi:hypothetical protein
LKQGADVEQCLVDHRDNWAKVAAEMSKGKSLYAQIDQLCFDDPSNAHPYTKEAKKELRKVSEEISNIIGDDAKLQQNIASYVARETVSLLSPDVDTAELPYGLRTTVTDLPPNLRELADTLVDIEMYSYYVRLDEMIDSEQLVALIQGKFRALEYYREYPDGPEVKRKGPNVIFFSGPPGAGKGTLLAELNARCLGTGTAGYLGGGELPIGERNYIAAESTKGIPEYDEAAYVVTAYNGARGRGKMFPTNLMNIAAAKILLAERARLDALGQFDASIIIEGFPRSPEQFAIFKGMNMEGIVVVGLELEADTAVVRQIMRIFEKHSKGLALRKDDFVGVDASKARPDFMQFLGINFETREVSADMGQLGWFIEQLFSKNGLAEINRLGRFPFTRDVINLGRDQQQQKRLSDVKIARLIKEREPQIVQAFIFGAMKYYGSELHVTTDSRYNKMLKAGDDVLKQCRKHGVPDKNIHVRYNANTSGPKKIARQVKEALGL